MPEATDIAGTIADVYARSLIELAQEKGFADQIGEEFAALIDYMRKDPAFHGFMTSAAIDDDPRRRSLEKLFRGRMNDLLLSMLQVLNNRGRCELIPAIHERYRLLLEELHGQEEVFVTSAHPLGDDVAAELRTELAARIGREPLLITTVDPDLLGGLVIQVGDRRIDASVRGKIQRFRTLLSDRAGKEIHTGKHDFIIETG
jgi:F-type H+-transporting ATPase subunit delta